MEKIGGQFDQQIDSHETVTNAAPVTQNEFVLVEEELFVPALLQEC